MSIWALNKISSDFFRLDAAAAALALSKPAARVALSRYAKKGFLVRVKRDVYMLSEKWGARTPEKMHVLANFLQVPSYISFMTALSFYEISTQIQRDFVESAAVTRTKAIKIREAQFQYTKLRKKLYFGFLKKNGFFIATPEKALLDSLYLMSLGRYHLDLNSLDKNKFDKKKLAKLCRFFPERTRRALEAYARFRPA